MLKRADFLTQGLYPKDVDAVMHECIDLVVNVVNSSKDWYEA